MSRDPLSAAEENGGQIDEIVRLKNHMWEQGFRNGAIAYTPTDYHRQSYYYSLCNEYKLAFSEGYFYARWKEKNP